MNNRKYRHLHLVNDLKSCIDEGKGVNENIILLCCWVVVGFGIGLVILMIANRIF